MKKHKNWGGARGGAGRPKRIHTITISDEAAQSIKILLLAAGRAYTPDTVAAWVEAQARIGWEAYDAEISGPEA